MAYQALYRQWRPQDFAHMVGQETIRDTLRNQVMMNRIAHAYLFCGSRGTGKTSTAKILSRAINCEHPTDGDPCGKCENCRRMLADESLDVIEIDAASNNGVDEMRDLRETVKYPPQYGRFKVYIIDEVHMLSNSAFNALLKTLEEPPAYVVFILATTEPQKLPATVLSRCQRFDFGRIPAAQIEAHLRDVTDAAGGSATNGALMTIARAAEGGMRDALSILDICLGYGKEITEELVHTVLGTSDRSFLFRFAEALADGNAALLVRLIDELMRNGREPAVFAKDISAHIRALLTAKCCPEDLEQLLDLTEEDAKEYVRQAEVFTVTRLMNILDLFMAVETEIRYASSPRLALETAALKASLRTREADTQALNDRIDELEKKIADLTSQLAKGIRAAPAAEMTKTKQLGNVGEIPEQQKMNALGRGTDHVWKEAMTVLSKTEPGSYNILGEGKYLGSDGNCYRWQCPLGQDFYVQALMADIRRKAIEEALTNAAGTPSVFQAVAVNTEPGKTDDENAYLDVMRNTFGAAAVTVQDQ